jgi:periplasmic divalent cation tolerance protein
MDCSNPLQPVAVATTTVDSPEAAQRLAQAAVQARLAACVQVEAITSHYVWQGQQAVDALAQWLHAAHPYDVPQWLVRTEQAAPAYAEWVAQQVAVKK